MWSILPSHKIQLRGLLDTPQSPAQVLLKTTSSPQHGILILGMEVGVNQHLRPRTKTFGDLLPVVIALQMMTVHKYASQSSAQAILRFLNLLPVLIEHYALHSSA